MGATVDFTFIETDLDAVAATEGRIAVVIGAAGKMGPAARRLNKLTRGALARMIQGKAWSKAKSGDVVSLAWPTGLAAEAVDVIKLTRPVTIADARKAGVALGARKGKTALTLLAESMARSRPAALAR